MMQEARVHQHQRNYGADGEMYGQKLDLDDIIREGDVQSSSRSRVWTKCPAKRVGRKWRPWMPVVIRPLPVLTLGEK